MIPAIPIATYRVQLTASFGFDAAAAVVPYLKELGISHLYASPFMKARAGSTHGYDIVDHNVINPELGGEPAFDRLSTALKEHGVGLILDFVPNHMGVHFADNMWWLDVLEWGKGSPHAASFDIDWDTLPHGIHGGVLLPVLGTSYGEALNTGQITLKYQPKTGFSAWYFEHRLPIAPQRYSEIIRVAVSEAGIADTESGRRLLDLAAQYTGPRRPDRSEAQAFKEAIAAVGDTEAILNRGLVAYWAGVDRPQQTQALHYLLERQHYKLAHWQLATSEINYRRFFDVNSLAGLRVEDQATFDAIHGLVGRLIREDRLDGLRLDHIDGLRDPAQYCQRLHRMIGQARGNSNKPFYLLVEKILGEGEQLPRLQGVHGTTGYEWLNVISRVLPDSEGLKSLDETWRQATSQPPNFPPYLMAAKRRVLETILTSEFTVLCRLLARIAGGHYLTRDFSADTLRQALELYVLHFPVYRTYVTAGGPSQSDRELIARTITNARSDWFNADDGIFEFLESVLTLDILRSERGALGKPRIRRFAFKVQQFTGPMMAKSLEDTAFYRFHRLIALNEVGGNPAATRLSANEFHDIMRDRQKDLPYGMTATATHDTKRGEDARARILAISELSGEWTNLVGKWKAVNAPQIASVGPLRCPTLSFEYMLYQSLIGAWPDRIDRSFIERFKAFAQKAAREAKLETSWLNPNVVYEDSVATFIENILDPHVSQEFLSSIEDFAKRMARLGALNSIVQLTLKAAMPGVPDFYQGSEFFDHSFVDPDNRRAVDFEARQKALDEVNTMYSSADGCVNDVTKFRWTKMLLETRQRFPEIFTDGAYRPVEVTGQHKDHVIAFARVLKKQAVVVAVATRFAPFTDGGRKSRVERLEASLDVAQYSGEGLQSAQGGRLALSELFGVLPAVIIPCSINSAGKGRRA